MKKFQVFGATSPEISEREMKHRVIARKAATEGIVLLENNGVLPMQPGPIALYGPGSRMTVRGGSGSGDLHERYSVSIEDGLKNAGFSFPTTLYMDRFSEKYKADVAAWRARTEEMIKGYGPIRTMAMFIKIGENPMPLPSCTQVLPDELTDETDTAVYVLSRQAGEGHDRKVEKGDYLLSDIEEESIKLLSEHYKKFILVLNCGSVIDLSILDEVRVDAVIFYAQAGTEGGNALADILTGKTCPSGRLVDTWAYHYEDYPCADTFGARNGDLDNEEYAEGIYVGYRWFEKNGIRPRYPFGFGRSYTSFEVKAEKVDETGVTVRVTNTGSCAGKDAALLYIAKPEHALCAQCGQQEGCVSDREKRSLAAFGKTKELQPGESEALRLDIDLEKIASFDEARHAFFLEAGEYGFYLGDEPCGGFTLAQELIWPIERTKRKETHSERINGLMSRLSDKEKIMLVVGGGYPTVAYNQVMGAGGRTCTKLLKRGIPNIVMADGPAGLNIMPEACIAKNGQPAYPNGLPEDWKWGWLKNLEGFFKTFFGKGTAYFRYMTAWPSATVMAQTLNTELLNEIGAAVGKEMLEIGVSVWLAPAMNIHRSPLCGRNFEYYSEDPIIAGKMAAAVTRGVQSAGGVGVSLKHFCCNNQEDNRMMVSENLSERALREIYLRGFEIAVKEGRPWTVMSSYNKINGKHVVNTRELLTGVLREEWGYTGLVMSDWNATEQCSYPEAINAGNDLIMPGTDRIVKALCKDLKAGKLDREALELSAARVLELVLKSETCKEFR